MQQSHETATSPSGVCTSRIAAGSHQGTANGRFEADANYLLENADGIAAIVSGESGQSGAKPDDDPRFLRTIIERLRSSKRFTDKTNQDCAVLVRKANRLCGLVATLKTLASK